MFEIVNIKDFVPPKREWVIPEILLSKVVTTLTASDAFECTRAAAYIARLAAENGKTVLFLGNNGLRLLKINSEKQSYAVNRDNGVIHTSDQIYAIDAYDSYFIEPVKALNPDLIVIDNATMFCGRHPGVEAVAAASALPLHIDSRPGVLVTCPYGRITDKFKEYPFTLSVGFSSGRMLIGRLRVGELAGNAWQFDNVPGQEDIEGGL